MNTKERIQNIISLVFKGIAVAMAVAAVVTNILKVMPVESQLLLLGFGLFALAITALDQE